MPDLSPMPIASEYADRWYMPSWWDRMALLNWRLIYFFPALLVLGLFAWAPFAMLLWWKLLVPAFAMPLTAAINAAKHAIRLRKEPFCIHCGYDLTGLPEGHACPECGIPFNFGDIDDYRRDPHWFIQRRRRNQPLPKSGAMIDAGPKRSKKSRDGT